MFRSTFHRFPSRVHVKTQWNHTRNFFDGRLPEEYEIYETAIHNIGGLTPIQRKQFQMFCQCLLASQRHKIDMDFLHDQYFDIEALPPIPEVFPHLNVTSLREPTKIFSRHFADALTLIPTIEKLDENRTGDKPLSIVDVGSGGGLPGIALAIARPDWQISTVETIEKKCEFMQHVVEHLRLRNVKVFCGRAQNLTVPGHEVLPMLRASTLVSDIIPLKPKPVRMFETADFCVARGVTALQDLQILCLPFVKPGGYFIAQKAGQVNALAGIKPPEESDIPMKGYRRMKEIVEPIQPSRAHADRSNADLHADTPAFVQAVRALSDCSWNPIPLESHIFSHINHEIKNGIKNAHLHGANPTFEYVYCEPFFAKKADPKADVSKTKQLSAITLTQKISSNVYCNIPDQLRFLVVMTKATSLRNLKIETRKPPPRLMRNFKNKIPATTFPERPPKKERVRAVDNSAASAPEEKGEELPKPQSAYANRYEDV